MKSKNFIFQRNLRLIILLRYLYEVYRYFESLKISEESEYDINKVENITTETSLSKGKIEAKAGTFNNRNQLTERNGTPLTYDNNGNLKSYEYQYFYDYSNRLVRVETGTGVVVEYVYDAFGRRKSGVTVLCFFDLLFYKKLIEKSVDNLPGCISSCHEPQL